MTAKSVVVIEWPARAFVAPIVPELALMKVKDVSEKLTEKHSPLNRSPNLHTGDRSDDAAIKRRGCSELWDPESPRPRAAYSPFRLEAEYPLYHLLAKHQYRCESQSRCRRQEEGLAPDGYLLRSKELSALR